MRLSLISAYGTLSALLITIGAHGQKVDSYLSDMRDALVPYGTLSAPSCHLIEIDLNGPWSDLAMPAGVNKEQPNELLWAILRAHVLKLYIDLAELDEDKIESKQLSAWRT